jgi:hypothetical protein
MTGLYIPKNFIVHAASLGQGFPHCRSFSTAASRRSLGRISVPVWPDTLSGRLPIDALVGHYPTNKLMGGGTIFPRQLTCRGHLYRHIMRCAEPCGISTPLGMLSPTERQVSHPLLTRSPLYLLPEGSFLVRLACLIHAANVRSEPGSNSPLSKANTDNPKTVCD